MKERNRQDMVAVRQVKDFDDEKKNKTESAGFGMTRNLIHDI